MVEWAVDVGTDSPPGIPKMVLVPDKAKLE